MHNQSLANCAAALLLIAAAIPSFAQESPAPVKVKMAELPAAVQRTIHAQAGKGGIKDIEMSSGHGETTYDVEIRKNNRLRSFTVDEDGALLGQEVFLGETPAPVQAAIRKFSGTNEIEGITKILDEEKIAYGVETTVASGTRAFKLDDQGALLEMQYFLPELPAMVRQTIQKELGKDKLGDITKVMDDGETNYEVEITAGEKSRTAILDPQGVVISHQEEIALRDTPDAVQSAVKTLVKDGKLGTITKSIEDDETTYDVETKLGGKWKTTSFGADGQVAE